MRVGYLLLNIQSLIKSGELTEGTYGVMQSKFSKNPPF